MEIRVISFGDLTKLKYRISQRKGVLNDGKFVVGIRNIVVCKVVTSNLVKPFLRKL